MASPNSPLANVLNKSLNMNWSVSESWNWNTAAKGLREKYTELLALRKGIKKLVDRDWVDLANRYDALIQKMVALESVKIGTSDDERKTYTKKVAALIGDAETLKRDIENEPNRLKAESDYKERSARVDALLQYATTNGLLKLQPYSNLTQAQRWIADGPTDNQRKSISNTVNLIDEDIKQRKAVADREAQARETQRKLEEEKQNKLKAEQEARDKLQLESKQKSAQQDVERRAKASAVEDLVDEAIQAVADESALYAKLQTGISGIEAKLAEPRHGVLRDNLAEVKKSIENGNRQPLMNKSYAVLAPNEPGFKGLSDALAAAQSHIDGLSIRELENLERDLKKVHLNLATLEQNRPGYQKALQGADPDRVGKVVRDPKVRGYVFTDALAAARADLNDVVGILGGERRGRTSPNGRTNHIHIAGNANYNAMFDWGGPGGEVRLLGFVNGHMERGAPPPVLQEDSRVEDRAATANFTLVEVDVLNKTMDVVPT